MIKLFGMEKGYLSLTLGYVPLFIYVIDVVSLFLSLTTTIKPLVIKIRNHGNVQTMPR